MFILFQTQQAQNSLPEDGQVGVNQLNPIDYALWSSMKLGLLKKYLNKGNDIVTLMEIDLAKLNVVSEGGNGANGTAATMENDSAEPRASGDKEGEVSKNGVDWEESIVSEFNLPDWYLSEREKHVHKFLECLLDAALIVLVGVDPRIHALMV